MQRILVQDKMFYKQLLLIALPIATQNMVNFGVSMADTMMLGKLGDAYLSAAANANQLGFVFTLLTFGVGSGSNVMISQFWGRGERERIHRVMTVMYRLLLAAGVLFSCIALFLPRFWMSIFTTDQEVIEMGVIFLRIIGYSYLMQGITSATVIVLRSVAAVNIALVVYLSSLVVNVTLNYALIFGHFGFPELGIQGAALATCIARLVEFIILISYMMLREKKIQFRLRSLIMKNVGIAREFTATALPVIFNEILWGSGIAVVAVIIGRMGTQFTAANSIVTVLSQLVTIAIYGVGNAAAVIVGNTVGAGKYDTARQYASTFGVLAVALGCISSCIVLLLRGPLLSFYNISNVAKEYAAQIMLVYAVVVIFQSLGMHLLIGVLRGAGDTRYVLMADVLFLWVISIPLGFLTGLYLGWPVWAVYAIIKSDELLKTIAAIWRIRRGGWINDVTKK